MLCQWSDQSEFIVALTVFKLWIGPSFMLGLVGNFQFFDSHFHVTTLGLELLSGAYPNKFIVCAVPTDEIAGSKGPARLGASLLDRWK